MEDKPLRVEVVGSKLPEALLNLCVNLVAVFAAFGLTFYFSGHSGTPLTLDQTPDSSPAYLHLPAGSPLKESGVPNMDETCGDLGRPADGWVPGQTASHSLDGRVLHGRGQAYTWTCGGTGATLTPNDVTAGCQIWKPGSTAYTWDPNYAYSWFCL